MPGILRYGNNTNLPTTTAWDQTIRAGACEQEPAASLVPYLSLDAGSNSTGEDLSVTLAESTEGILYWYLGNETMEVSYDDPTVLEIINGNTSFSNSSNIYQMPSANKWIYLVVESTLAVPHPIHLHGKCNPIFQIWLSPNFRLSSFQDMTFTSWPQAPGLMPLQVPPLTPQIHLAGM